MAQKLKYFTLPTPLIDIQKNTPLTEGLWLSEIGEIRVEKGTAWNYGKGPVHVLIYCHSGQGIVQLPDGKIPISNSQFIIIPQNRILKYYSGVGSDSHIYFAGFNGSKVDCFASEFLQVRNLIPSVNNRVANREMLFDEIFNNLSKGYHDENMNYINFCFGHLLATFVFAYRTSDDIKEETNPVVSRALDYFEKNLDKKLTLNQVSQHVGYSPTYFTTLFRNTTGYSPLSFFSHLKILKACEYLDQTNLKIKEISFQLGYTDPYYFSKDFSNRMGLSPRNYRNRVALRL